MIQNWDILWFNWRIFGKNKKWKNLYIGRSGKSWYYTGCDRKVVLN